MIKDALTASFRAAQPGAAPGTFLHPGPAQVEAPDMTQTMTSLKLGQRVPDFELKTYDPARGEFGKFRFQDQVDRKRWTILFFYPADFTFV
jgi:hypothetical protein